MADLFARQRSQKVLQKTLKLSRRKEAVSIRSERAQALEIGRAHV